VKSTTCHYDALLKNAVDEKPSGTKYYRQRRDVINKSIIRIFRKYLRSLFRKSDFKMTSTSNNPEVLEQLKEGILKSLNGLDILKGTSFSETLDSDVSELRTQI